MTVTTDQLLAATGTSLLPEDERKSVYEAVTQCMLDSFKNEDSVAIPGFGTFTAAKRHERIATDPATGKRMLYPPCVRLTYQPSVILRKKITG